MASELALDLCSLGENQAALDLAEDTLTRHRQQHSADPNVPYLLSYLAEVLRMLGEDEEAARLESELPRGR